LIDVVVEVGSHAAIRLAHGVHGAVEVIGIGGVGDQMGSVH
jgi:hypothetical protein